MSWLSLSTSASNQATQPLLNTTRHVLPNGLVALIYRNPTTPTVSVRGRVALGAAYEHAAKSGLAAFTAATLIRGTQHRTFQQLVAETEERGCSVNAGGGMHSSSFGGKALAEDLPLILDVLADMVKHPTFPSTEVEKLRGQFLTGLRESEEETRFQASRALRKLLYPAEHPYSRLSSGSIETVQALTRDDLVAFHQWYRPDLTTIAIVGDVQADQVIATLEQTFGDWQGNTSPPDLLWPAVLHIEQPQQRHITLAGKVQTDIIWAVHGLKRQDPAYYPAMVGNIILGRLGMGGRLSDAIRQEQGLAYYASSSLDADVQAGPWAAGAGVNPAHVQRVIELLLHEIETFRQQGPTAEELDDTKAFLTGSMALRLEANDGIAAMLLGIEEFDLGLDYVVRYPAIIHDVTAEQVTDVARTYLSTERYVLATAGPDTAKAL
ncbi:MAG: insulinase family protein [Chloroflexaceae bacterium]|nr:insulinase family protein [Chloroflexaceae bacterium]